MDFAAHSWPLFFLCFAAGYLLGRLKRHRRGQAAPVPRSDISDADIESAVRTGRLVDAIRLYRQRSGAGLKEAKTAVEAMAERLGASP